MEAKNVLMAFFLIVWVAISATTVKAQVIPEIPEEEDPVVPLSAGYNDPMGEFNDWPGKLPHGVIRSQDIPAEYTGRMALDCKISLPWWFVKCPAPAFLPSPGPVLSISSEPMSLTTPSLGDDTIGTSLAAPWKGSL